MALRLLNTIQLQNPVHFIVCELKSQHSQYKHEHEISSWAYQPELEFMMRILCPSERVRTEHLTGRQLTSTPWRWPGRALWEGKKGFLVRFSVLAPEEGFLQNSVILPEMVAHTCDSQETKAVELWVWGLANLHSRFKVGLGPYSIFQTPGNWWKLCLTKHCITHP